MRKVPLCVLGCLALFLTVCPALAAIQLEPVLTGLSSPLYLTSARDGTNRLFIVERPGTIKVHQPGATTPTDFLDIRSRVLSGGERGLLGLAFHPAYATNGRFFVHYTQTQEPVGAIVIAEYRVSGSNRNVADLDETQLLVVPHPTFDNHNGGMIEFGSDGFLYIALGDGGGANDPDNRAQGFNQLLGKILRIDVNTGVGCPPPYCSPPDNPFASTDGRDEIFALGLRNPWRFSFDRETDDLLVADVGQSAREEIDIVTLGGNYGWRIFEGTRCNTPTVDPALCIRENFVDPIFEYTHDDGCSVTGGYVYRGARGSVPVGAYIFGDFCAGTIWQLQGGVRTLLLDTDLLISSFGEDETGEIYIVGLGGTVHRIVGAGSSPDGGGSKRCFIATAAFGFPLAREVQVLRQFRDRYLLTNGLGRSLVAAYYRLSPPLARVIAAHGGVQVAARGALWPLVWWARLALASPALGLALAGGGLVAGGGLCAFAARRWWTSWGRNQRMTVGDPWSPWYPGTAASPRAGPERRALRHPWRGGRVRCGGWRAGS